MSFSTSLSARRLSVRRVAFIFHRHGGRGDPDGHSSPVQDATGCEHLVRVSMARSGLARTHARWRRREDSRTPARPHVLARALHAHASRWLCARSFGLESRRAACA